MAIAAFTLASTPSALARPSWPDMSSMDCQAGFPTSYAEDGGSGLPFAEMGDRPLALPNGHSEAGSAASLESSPGPSQTLSRTPSEVMGCSSTRPADDKLPSSWPEMDPTPEFADFFLTHYSIRGEEWRQQEDERIDKIHSQTLSMWKHVNWASSQTSLPLPKPVSPKSRGSPKDSTLPCPSNLPPIQMPRALAPLQTTQKSRKRKNPGGPASDDHANWDDSCGYVSKCHGETKFEGVLVQLRRNPKRKCRRD